MSGDENGWCSVSEAARRLGVTRSAIYSRINRKTLETMTDNHGRPLVRVPVSGRRQVTGGSLRQVTDVTLTEYSPESRQSAAGASDAVQLSLHQAELDRLQAASDAAVAALQNQVEQLRSAMAAQQAQHREDMAQERAETARQLAARDSLHLDTLGRLQAQAAAERSLWLERIDAAELRSERLEQRLDQVLDQLLADRRQPVASQVELGERVPEPQREPWWRLLFGTSKRSKLGED
jgi:hypothetical protein